MSELIKKLKGGCGNPSRQEVRQYIELLSADSADAQSVQRMQALMLRLRKHPEDVEADRATLRRVAELRATIGRGTRLAEQTRAAQKAVDDHRKETDRINADRASELSQLSATLGGLHQDRSAAESAIKELAELKLRHDCLLADEPAVQLSELD